MLNENLCLPRISSNFFDFKKGFNSQRNLPSNINNYSNLNKIIRNCINKKTKSKYKMKIKKEFIGFQKSKKFLQNDKYEKLLMSKSNNNNDINNNNNNKRNESSSTRKFSSFSKTNSTNFLNKENSFYKYVNKNNYNKNIFSSNNKKQSSSHSRSKNIRLDNNIIFDNNTCRTYRKYSEIKNTPIKSLSQKKVNSLNLTKLFSSFYPFSNLGKEMKENFKIIISNNNKDKKSKNTSVEESKVKFSTTHKKILTSTNATSSIEITEKNENEYNILKNKIKNNFNSTIKKSLFRTKSNKNNNLTNNIKFEYIEHIKTLSVKLINEQINTPRKLFKNMYKLKLDHNKLFEYNIFYKHLNSYENNDYERNDLEIFLNLLDIHLKIENIIMKMKNNNIILCLDIENKNRLNTVNNLIELIDHFFSILKLVSFDIDFLIETNKNRLVRKTIKMLISYYSMIIVILKQSYINNAIEVLSNKKIFNQLSKLLYNIFDNYMLPDLINNNYKMKFMETYKEIIKKNNYIINNTNKDILSILIKKTDDCLCILKKKIEDIINNEKYITLNPVFNSILSLLVNINNKSILTYINITINVILYSILQINYNKPNKKALNDRNKINDTSPYLPPIDKKYKYSLVLDMDGTLIHFLYKNKTSNSIFKFNVIENDIMQLGMFLLRPYTKLFFEKLKNFYEIIIFTNGTKEYCDKILDFIDPNQEYIKFRLYRKHSINKDNDNYLKDLSLLGRDLSKIIIIDDLAQNYKLQQDNGLPITSWKGDINDTALKDLIPILKKIVEDNVEDVRNVIVKIKNKLNDEKDINYLNINKDTDLL